MTKTTPPPIRYRHEGDVRAVQIERRIAQEQMPAHEWSAKREALGR